jgi:hypothetical protein
VTDPAVSHMVSKSFPTADAEPVMAAGHGN